MRMHILAKVIPGFHLNNINDLNAYLELHSPCAEEAAQQLRTWTALAEDPSLVLSTILGESQ